MSDSRLILPSWICPSDPGWAWGTWYAATAQTRALAERVSYRIRWSTHGASPDFLCSFSMSLMPAIESIRCSDAPLLPFSPDTSDNATDSEGGIWYLLQDSRPLSMELPYESAYVRPLLT